MCFALFFVFFVFSILTPASHRIKIRIMTFQDHVRKSREGWGGLVTSFHPRTQVLEDSRNIAPRIADFVDFNWEMSFTMIIRPLKQSTWLFQRRFLKTRLSSSEEITICFFFQSKDFNTASNDVENNLLIFLRIKLSLSS